jgi:hypothetical protein
MYLHGMDASGVILRLSRHSQYRGPSPKYSSFREFEQQRQAKLAANKTSQTALSLTIDDHSDSKNTIMDSTVQASSEVSAPLVVEESSAQAQLSGLRSSSRKYPISSSKIPSCFLH